MSKQQIRHAGGDASCGRHKVGLLKSLGGETHTQGMYLGRWIKHKTGNNKRKITRKDRRRARPERQRKRRTRRMTRARFRTGELNVAAWIASHCPLRETGRPDMPRFFCRNVQSSAVTS